MSSGPISLHRKNLTPAQYGDLADVRPEVEWLANITDKKTRRAYKLDASEFSAITGLKETVQLRTNTRAQCHRVVQGYGNSFPIARKHPAQALGAVVAP